MGVAWAVGIAALVAILGVLGVPQDASLQGEPVGTTLATESVLVPQTIQISTEVAYVEPWQAESLPMRQALESMPQNAHAITSSQMQIALKTWKISGGAFAIDDTIGDIYSSFSNKVQMIDVSENIKMEWNIPADRLAYSPNQLGVFVADSKYWFGTGTTIHRLDPSTGIFTVWDNIQCSRFVVALITDNQGNIWCQGDANVLIKLDPRQNEATTVTLPYIGRDTYNRTMHVNSSGSIFVAGYAISGERQEIMQINASLNSAKVWNVNEEYAYNRALYVAGDKAYFMKHFPYRQVLAELDTTTDTLREWSLPYQTSSRLTSIVVDSHGNVFFDMSGAVSGLHRFVPETAEFTKFNVKPFYVKIDSSDTIYMSLGSSVAAAT